LLYGIEGVVIISVNLYDDAIVTKLRTLLNNDKIFITPPDNVFRIIDKTADDVINLPMISLTRTGFSIRLDKVQHSMMFEGSITDMDADTHKSKRVQTIPIRINYLMDVWTRTRHENDVIVRDLVLYFMTHPTMNIEIPYNLNKTFNFNMFLDADIEDNSDIVAHKDRGIYYRQTISMYTDDAYLFKSSTRNPTYLDIEYEIEDNDLI